MSKWNNFFFGLLLLISGFGIGSSAMALNINSANNLTGYNVFMLFFFIGLAIVTFLDWNRRIKLQEITTTINNITINTADTGKKLGEALKKIGQNLR